MASRGAREVAPPRGRGRGAGLVRLVVGGQLGEDADGAWWGLSGHRVNRCHVVRGGRGETVGGARFTGRRQREEKPAQGLAGRVLRKGLGEAERAPRTDAPTQSDHTDEVRIRLADSGADAPVAGVDDAPRRAAARPARARIRRPMWRRTRRPTRSCPTRNRRPLRRSLERPSQSWSSESRAPGRTSRPRIRS